MILKLNTVYLSDVLGRSENNRVKKRESLDFVKDYFTILKDSVNWQNKYKSLDSFSNAYYKVINRLNSDEFRKFKRVAEKNVKKGSVMEADDVFIRKPRITDYFK